MAELVEPKLLAAVSELGHPPRVLAVFRRADLPTLVRGGEPSVGPCALAGGRPGECRRAHPLGGCPRPGLRLCSRPAAPTRWARRLSGQRWAPPFAFRSALRAGADAADRSRAGQWHSARRARARRACDVRPRDRAERSPGLTRRALRGQRDDSPGAGRRVPQCRDRRVDRALRVATEALASTAGRLGHRQSGQHLDAAPASRSRRRGRGCPRPRPLRR